VREEPDVRSSHKWLEVKFTSGRYFLELASPVREHNRFRESSGEGLLSRQQDCRAPGATVTEHDVTDSRVR
jgi:hypothetical protein